MLYKKSTWKIKEKPLLVRSIRPSIVQIHEESLKFTILHWFINEIKIEVRPQQNTFLFPRKLSINFAIYFNSKGTGIPFQIKRKSTKQFSSHRIYILLEVSIIKRYIIRINCHLYQ